MARCWLILLMGASFTGSSLLSPGSASAQHFHGGFNGYSQPWIVNPGLGHSGYPGSGYRHASHHRLGYSINYIGLPPQPSPFVSYQEPVWFIPEPTLVVRDPLKNPVVPSTPAARMRSLEYQAKGDQRMRQQKWSDARNAYRISVDAAPDRAEAHLRLGLCLVAIQQFEPAIRQFKRALFIDPRSPNMGKLSQTLFGPDSGIVRMSIVSKVSDWVREDYKDSERLFLLGAILHFEGDARALEVLDAAKRMKRRGDVSHIAALLDPVAANPNVPGIGNPALNGQPVPLDIKPKAGVKPEPRPIPGAPVPMPDL